MLMKHEFHDAIMDADLEVMREAVRERLEALKGENLLQMDADTISRLTYEMAMLKASLHAENPRGPLPVPEAPR